MARETKKLEAQAPAAGLIADRRLFLTAGNKVVEEGDPDAAFLLAAPGSLIPAAEVNRLGLELKGEKVTQSHAAATAVAASGGAVLDARGAVEAAVKDQLKADFDVQVKEETDKELADLPTVADDSGAGYQLALNRAGTLSRDALRRRGESTREEPGIDAAAEAEAKALEAKAEEQAKAADAAGKRGKK